MLPKDSSCGVIVFLSNEIRRKKTCLEFGYETKEKCRKNDALDLSNNRTASISFMKYFLIFYVLKMDFVLSQLLKKVFRKSLHKIQCCIFTVWNNTCVLILSGTSGTSQIYVAFSNLILKMQLQMSLAARNISGVNLYLLLTLPPLRRLWCTTHIKLDYVFIYFHPLIKLSFNKKKF